VSIRFSRSIALCAALLTVPATAASADAYPSRPVRFVVPLATGGGTDIVSRLFAQKLSETWGQQVVVDNRPGAGGIIGAEIAAKALPDGYTLVMVSSSHTVHPSMHRKLPYDTVNDFAPVSMLVTYPFLLVTHPSVQAKSVKELIAMAKAKPGGLTYASSGPGSAAHLAAELFRSLSAADLTHVQYKGSGPAVTAIVAGEAATGFFSASATAQHVRAGRLKALATTGARRSPSMPDLPTIAESALSGYEASTWAGVLVPARTPGAIVKRLHADLTRILGQRDVRERIAALEFEPVGSSPAEFGATIARELVKWGKVVRDSGAKVE
jgi:tripartite-type tricarboxylate transporter receptor subunit TctC